MVKARPRRRRNRYVAALTWELRYRWRAHLARAAWNGLLLVSVIVIYARFLALPAHYVWS